MNSACPGCLALQAKLERAADSLRNAKTAAREGLMDMAEQNAKLVAAYVEKKREVKQLQVGLMVKDCGSSSSKSTCRMLQHASDTELGLLQFELKHYDKTIAAVLLVGERPLCQCQQLMACTAPILQAAAKDDRRLWQQRLQRMEHELQANKLHIQALMQQLHAIAAKQALGGSDAADQADADQVTQAAASPAAAAPQPNSRSSSSPRPTAADAAASDNAAGAGSPGGSGSSCCSSSGGSAFTPVRSFSCHGVASPGSSEATSRCRPATSNMAGMHICWIGACVKRAVMSYATGAEDQS